MLHDVLHTLLVLMEGLTLGSSPEWSQIFLRHARVCSMILSERAIIVEDWLAVKADRLNIDFVALCLSDRLIILVPVACIASDHVFLLQWRRRLRLCLLLWLVFFVVLKVFEVAAHIFYLLLVLENRVGELLTRRGIASPLGTGVAIDGSLSLLHTEAGLVFQEAAFSHLVVFVKLIDLLGDL